ncbi:MAG: hypothetical protein ACWA5P_10890 [bacterium]
MIPTDSEFILLYAAFGIMALFLVRGLMSASKKKFYRWNAIVYLGYLALMIFEFSDKENFSGGGSLVVLFYGALFVLAHFTILILIKLAQIIKKKD